MPVDWTKIDKNDPAARAQAVRDAIRAERRKLPKVNASGYALPYDQQGTEYRQAVSREAHERAHGAVNRASHHAHRG